MSASHRECPPDDCRSCRKVSGALLSGLAGYTDAAALFRAVGRLCGLSSKAVRVHVAHLHQHGVLRDDLSVVPGSIADPILPAPEPRRSPRPEPRRGDVVDMRKAPPPRALPVPPVRRPFPQGRRSYLPSPDSQVIVVDFRTGRRGMR